MSQPAPAAQPVLPPQAPKLQLRPEVYLSRDLVTFGDLIAGLGGETAQVAAFRGPALGETGTIQVARIVEAARGPASSATRWNWRARASRRSS